MRALVVGSGAAGLRTAVELARRKVQVVLRSPEHPLDASCSAGAGGLWMPVHCGGGAADPRAVDRWAIETLDELMPVGENPDDGVVEMLHAVDLKRDHAGPDVPDFASSRYEKAGGGSTQTAKLPGWTRDPRIGFQHLSVEMLYWQNVALKLRLPPMDSVVRDAGYRFAWFFRAPVVDAPKMLGRYLDEVVRSGGSGGGAEADVDVETGHRYESVAEMVDAARSLECDAVFNCTGLGAAEIVDSESGDDRVVGGRGVTLRFDRRSVARHPDFEVAHCNRETAITSDISSNSSIGKINDCVLMTSEKPWAGDSETSPCYLIPRGDVLVVGGTMLVGDGEPGLREQERQRLLRNAAILGGIDASRTPPVAEWTGFRPYRPSGVRCEVDGDYNGDGSGGVKVIHNYGHGGSGWTINVGTARQAVDLMLGSGGGGRR